MNHRFLFTCLEKTAMSSLKESEEQTSAPATALSLGVQVASSHFSKMSASSGNKGCLQEEQRRRSDGAPTCFLLLKLYPTNLSHTAVHGFTLNVSSSSLQAQRDSFISFFCFFQDPCELASAAGSRPRRLPVGAARPSSDLLCLCVCLRCTQEYHGLFSRAH